MEDVREEEVEREEKMMCEKINNRTRAIMAA